VREPGATAKRADRFVDNAAEIRIKTPDRYYR
jgi:hypothetical protein